MRFRRALGHAPRRYREGIVTVTRARTPVPSPAARKRVSTSNCWQPTKIAVPNAWHLRMQRAFTIDREGKGTGETEPSGFRRDGRPSKRRSRRDVVPRRRSSSTRRKLYFRSAAEDLDRPIDTRNCKKNQKDELSDPPRFRGDFYSKLPDSN